MVIFNSYVSLPEGIELLKAILGSQCAKNIKASESISGTYNGVIRLDELRLQMSINNL